MVYERERRRSCWKLLIKSLYLPYGLVIYFYVFEGIPLYFTILKGERGDWLSALF